MTLKEKPWYLIGIIISTIIYVVFRLLMNISLENLAKTSIDGNFDIGWGYIFGFLLMLLSGIIIVTLITSFVIQRKGVTQFKVWHLIVIVILVLGLFFSHFIFKNMFPVIYNKDIESCSQYASEIWKEGCINAVCSRGATASNDLNTHKCLFDSAIRLTNPEICDDIDINFGKHRCVCFSTLAEKGFIQYSMKDFLANNGNCSRYSNLEKENFICSVIQSGDSSLCNSVETEYDRLIDN
jgi:hypothetical protein